MLLFSSFLSLYSNFHLFLLFFFDEHGYLVIVSTYNPSLISDYWVSGWGYLLYFYFILYIFIYHFVLGFLVPLRARYKKIPLSDEIKDYLLFVLFHFPCHLVFFFLK